MSDLLNSAVKDGAISFEHSFNNLADISSRPVALSVERFESRELVSSVETEMDLRVTSSKILEPTLDELGVEG